MPQYTEEDIKRMSLLSSAPQLEHVRVLFEGIQYALDKQRIALETKSCVNNEEIKRDFRYMLGRISAFEEVLNRPEKARKALESMEARQEE